jgi:hypothetical protein
MQYENLVFLIKIIKNDYRVFKFLSLTLHNNELFCNLSL